MLKSRTLFGLTLVVAAVVIGVHAYDNHSAKTEPVGVIAKCFGQPPAGEVKCDETEPVKVLIDKPCPPSKIDANGNADKKISVKELSSKKKSFLGKRHHHKSKASHHHKSKPHHSNHHHHGHHHGHGHSGPQKIPSHGAPPHLTGPPGCG